MIVRVGHDRGKVAAGGKLRDMKDFSTIRTEIEARCKAAGMVAKEHYLTLIEDDGTNRKHRYGWTLEPVDDPYFIRPSANVGDGKEDRDEAGLRFAVSTRFEVYRHLHKYEGAWSASDGVVEVEVAMPPTVFDYEGVVEAISREIADLERGFWGAEFKPRDAISLQTASRDVEVVLTYGSPEFLLWRTASVAMNSLSPAQRIPVIKVRTTELNTRVEAVELVERYGLAALVELTCSLGRSGQLQVPQPPDFRLGMETRRAPQQLTRAPQVEAALLYLHGRSERNDMVAKFLSFYQVLEFYFPRFWYETEASRLKDKLGLDTPDATIVAILKESAKRLTPRSPVKESEQLYAVIQHAITEQKLREFLYNDAELRAFYTSPQMPIVAARVPVDGKTSDPRKDLAERLYAIRNRIVHKKESSSEPVLLPFSPEVPYMDQDVRMIDLLARKLIESTGQPLK